MSDNQHCPHCGRPFVDAKTQYKLNVVKLRRAAMLIMNVVTLAVAWFSLAIIWGGAL